MNDTEKKENENTNDSSIYYILGGVVLVAAIAGFFLLKPKTVTSPTSTAEPVATGPTPTPAPISDFTCEKQYFNPVIGFPKYFLSAEGVDTKTTGQVSCQFNISVKDKVVATANVTAPVSEARERGGGTFRCQTDSVELARNVATQVEVTMTNEDNKEASCSQQFLFP